MSEYVRVSIYRETFEKLSGVSMVVGKNVNDYLREVVDGLYNKHVAEIVMLKIRESEEQIEKERWDMIRETREKTRIYKRVRK